MFDISPGALHKHCTLRKSFELLKIPCVAMFSRYKIISLETLALASSPPRLCKRPQEIAPQKAAVHEWHLCSILRWAWLCSCTDQQTQHWGQRAKTRYMHYEVFSSWSERVLKKALWMHGWFLNRLSSCRRAMTACSWTTASGWG